MKHNAMGTDPSDFRNAAIFNTTRQKCTHVDPRTGLFECFMPLPAITGNAGQGPVLDMSLYYSPAVNNIAALGDGWSFGSIATYFERNGALTLHTGEVILVEKGKAFESSAVKATWSDNDTTLTVERADGRVETFQKAGDSLLWTPVTITTDGYRYLHLTWATVEQSNATESPSINIFSIVPTPQVMPVQLRHQVRLTAIDDDGATDASGTKASPRRLLTIEYRADGTSQPDDHVAAPTEIRLNFWPRTREAMTFVLNLNDQYALTSIVPPEYAIWKATQQKSNATVNATDGPMARFAYQDHATCGWLLNEVRTFAGLTETVTYTDDGLTFAGNEKLSALPSVKTHIVKPRGNISETVATYDYQWVFGEGKNKLQSFDDVYRTTITQAGSIVTHFYSEDHSGTSEERKTNNAIVRVDCSTIIEKSGKTDSYLTSRDVKYGDTKTLSIASQAFFSAIGGQPSLRFTEASHTAFAYDASHSGFCKSLPNAEISAASKIDPGDVKLPDTEEPVDPNATSMARSFVKDVDADGYLHAWKRKDITGLDMRKIVPAYELASSEYGNADAPHAASTYLSEHSEHESRLLYQKSFTYIDITGLNREKLNTLKQACGPTLSAKLIQIITYYDGDDFRKGLKKSITQGNDDGNGGVVTGTGTFLSFAYTLNADQTEITMAITESRADTSRTTGETLSTLSGRLVSQLDADGNRATYAYDSAGRLITHVLCAQSDEYRQTTTYAYPQPGRIETTGPNGQKHATEQDGRGNTILEQVWHTEKSIYVTGSSYWLPLKTTSFDDQGRESSITQYDHFLDKYRPVYPVTKESSPYDRMFDIAETFTKAYDDWGNECSRTYSDGRVAFNQYDPITRVREEWVGAKDDKQRKRTTYKRNGSVAKVEQIDTHGEVKRTDTYTYRNNGWLLTLSRDTPHGMHTTTYSYDSIGRVTTETHNEDGSTYAYHYEYPIDWLVTEPIKRTVTWGAVTRTLGERTLDAWGRCTSLTRAGITETYTYSEAIPVPAARKQADGTTLAYTTIPELGHQVKTLTGGTRSQSFAYLHGSTRSSSAKESNTAVTDGEYDAEYASITYGHDPNGRVIEQCPGGRLDRETEVTRRYTPAGRLLSDAWKVSDRTEYSYNMVGQRVTTKALDGITYHAYDDRGRLASEGIRDDVIVTYTYDSEGKEISRRFLKTGDGAFDYTLNHTYFGDGRIQCVEWMEGNTRKGKRTYTYTPAGCVKSCSYADEWQPRTPGSKAISQQEFTYDGLGNVTACMTTFEGGRCTSRYTYDDISGCRLTGVTHDHPDYPRTTTPEFDRNGRIIKDITGKTYTYDWLGRMTRAGSRYYTYTPMNGLATTGKDDMTSTLVYDGAELRADCAPTGDGRWLNPGSTGCTVQAVVRSRVNRTLLELRDIDGTVLLTFDDTAKTAKYHTYTAWGGHSSTETDSLLGFKGEYRDADNDHYPLGQGYRHYNPDSMQFGVPDDWSPFGNGGPQAYGCFDGDPANMSDPSGHMAVGAGAVNRGLRARWPDGPPGPLGMSNGGIISALIWGAIGIMAAAFTGGASLLLTGALVGLAIVSAGLSIAAAALSDSDPKLAKIFGWAALGAGLVGGVASLGQKVVQFTLKLCRSGYQLGKTLLQKVAAAGSKLWDRGRDVISRWSGQSFRSPGTVLTPKPSYANQVLGNPLPAGKLPSVWGDLKDKVADLTFDSFHSTWGELAGAFDMGDLNTMVCAVSGGLSESGLLVGDEAIVAGHTASVTASGIIGTWHTNTLSHSFVARLGGLRFR